jgi:hypothetical protein
MGQKCKYFSKYFSKFPLPKNYATIKVLKYLAKPNGKVPGG